MHPNGKCCIYIDTTAQKTYPAFAILVNAQIADVNPDSNAHLPANTHLGMQQAYPDMPHSLELSWFFPVNGSEQRWHDSGMSDISK